MKRHLAVAAALGCVGTAAVVLPAAPASASTQCTTTTTRTVTDWAGQVGTITLPAASGGVINCFLAQGDSSSAVSALQNALVYCRHENAPLITVDGNFGPKTKAALQYEQTADSITADGVYGSVTRTHMGWRDNLGNCSFAP